MVRAVRKEKPGAQGWGRPANSNRWHYFVGAMSLCGKWMFGGHLEQGNDNHSDNCTSCKTKRATQLAREAKG